ncbi:MAG: hypothetical protein IJQ61_04180 [Bacteroidales bacterium]|nr:hypothetical protein [Bacteroidales bacterium]
MKPDKQIKYVRSLDEAQLKDEVINIESRILAITHDPIDFHNLRPFLDWCGDKKALESVQDMMGYRKFILDTLFAKHCTEAEIERLEKVNSLLLELTNRTYKRTADLFRALIAMPKDELDDDYEIEGCLVPEFDTVDSTLRLEEDTYYGSDFTRMAAILQETEKYLLDLAHVHPLWSSVADYSPTMSDKLNCENSLDDGTSWAEGALRNPKLEHITVCYALHALCTHMNFSIPDILRMNDFKSEVKLTVQQFSDQDRNRLKESKV